MTVVVLSASAFWTAWSTMDFPSFFVKVTSPMLDADSEGVGDLYRVVITMGESSTGMAASTEITDQRRSQERKKM